MSPQLFSKENSFTVTTIILSAISLLADIFGLGVLAYQIATDGVSENFVFQIIAVVLVFLLGLGLGAVGLSRGERKPVLLVLGIYIWAYLILACVTYLAIMVKFRAPYTVLEFITFLVIVGIQLLGFETLRRTSQVKTVTSYSLAMMTVSVIHAISFLYQFVIQGVPEIGYVIGEWLFWLSWTAFTIPYIRGAFGVNVGKSRFIRK